MSKRDKSQEQLQEERKALSEKVIDMIAEQGISLAQACRETQLHRRYFFEQIKLHSDLSNNYARACEIRCDMIADEILEIADKELETTERKKGFDDIKGSWNEEVKKDNIARTREQINARKWLLAKMMPRKYGNVVEKEEVKDQESNTIEAILTVPEDYENSFNEVEDEV